MELDHPKQPGEEKNFDSLSHHFLADNTAFSVQSVFNSEGPELVGRAVAGDSTGGSGREEGEGEGEGEYVDDGLVEERRQEMGQLDFGSCCVALTIRSRLLVLRIPHK